MSVLLKTKTQNPYRLKRNLEWEILLLQRLPGKFQESFKKNLNEANVNYWKIISEIKAIVIFSTILHLNVGGICVKTFKDKNVDFTIDFNGENVYVEVKGFDPYDYQESLRGGFLGPDEEKISRALERSQKKFLNNECNILVIADEDTIKLPLYENILTDLGRVPEQYLSMYENRKTNAIMILGGNFLDQSLKYKVWFNSNPLKSLPEELIEVLNQQKSNFWN